MKTPPEPRIPERQNFEIKFIMTKLNLPPRLFDFEVADEKRPCDICGGVTACRPRDLFAFTILGATERKPRPPRPNRHMICHTRTGTQWPSKRAYDMKPNRHDRARQLKLFVAARAAKRARGAT